MTLEDELTVALRDAAKEGPLVDPKIGRAWQVTLGRALGGQVQDETHYLSGRVYRFHFPVPATEPRIWQSVLRVLISGVGPFVTNVFVQRLAHDRWWCSDIRSSRIGFYPEDEEVLAHLRTWLETQGLKEVDINTQAQLVPKELADKGQDVTWFHQIFRQ